MIGLVSRILLTLILLIRASIGCDTIRYTNKLLIIINDGYVERVNEVVDIYDIQYERHVVGRVHEYKLKYAPSYSIVPIDEKILQEIIQKALETILEIYQVEEISLLLGNKLNRQPLLRLAKHPGEKNFSDCSTCYGMHIMDAWSQEYQGQGVVVAIVDTGAEITHKDIAPNINLRLSRNFVPNQPTEDVTPDILSSYMELDIYSDHGNNCAGLVGAVLENVLCNPGVAPYSSIAVLKVIELIEPDKLNRVLNFIPTSLLDALSYKRDEIHIYSISLGPSQDFSNSTVSMNEAFRVGVEKGRNGKGSIYVFAAGNKGKTKKNLNLDGYVNSIYTITISSVGVNGTIPEYAQPGAVVLASTYGDGPNKFASSMITTSHRNSCCRDFRGTSASASIASGMIALAIQANANLTWRDVQHVIVNTSRIDGLEGSEAVTTNGAGFSYHPYFGFGLMNASALVSSAKHWKNIPRQTMVDASSVARFRKKKKEIHSLSVDICKDSFNCPSFTEHVVAHIEYVSYYDQLVELELCAPSKSCSYLLTKQAVESPQAVKRMPRNWNFTSLQFWGENPKGTWDLTMYLRQEVIYLIDKQYTLSVFNLTVYGYSNLSYEVQQQVDTSNKRSEKASVSDKKSDIRTEKEKQTTHSDIEDLYFVSKYIIAFIASIAFIILYVYIRGDRHRFVRLPRD